MKSKLDELWSSIAELKTPKTIIAFRATCTKNFPSGERTHHSESQGKTLFKEFSHPKILFMYID